MPGAARRVNRRKAFAALQRTSAPRRRDARPRSRTIAKADDGPTTATRLRGIGYTEPMTLSNDDLSAYFARIFYAGSREPTLATLRGIVGPHATSIPFENLDVLLGRPIRLDPGALLDKLVHRRRGGYCFEHNTLLLGVLEALGFAVEGLAARVIWGRPEGNVGARSHMLLRVALPEGDFLADVGFGRVTLTAPLRLEVGLEQATPHEPHRLIAADGEFELEAWVDDCWMKLYRFALIRQLPVDYEVSNWFTSTHPGVLFTNHLMAARPEPDRRFALLNRNFTIRHSAGQVERHALADAAELGEVLARYFRVEMPDRADLAGVWERISRK
jgi:N-hydroxyarylamine O-acetyltransferase